MAMMILLTINVISVYVRTGQLAMIKLGNITMTVKTLIGLQYLAMP